MPHLRPLSVLSRPAAPSLSSQPLKPASLQLSRTSTRLLSLHAPQNSSSIRRWPPTNPPRPFLQHKAASSRSFHASTPSHSSPSASTPAQQPATSKLQPAGLSPSEYHRRADAYIEKLVAQLEEVQEERDEVDVEYSAGVLTLAFPPAGTYVLNKQPPNQQIWLSSPISGPKRYDYVFDAASSSGGGSGADPDVGGKGAGDWIYLRDGSSLTALLEGELGLEMGIAQQRRE